MRHACLALLHAVAGCVDQRLIFAAAMHVHVVVHVFVFVSIGLIGKRRKGKRAYAGKGFSTFHGFLRCSVGWGVAAARAGPLPSGRARPPAPATICRIGRMIRIQIIQFKHNTSSSLSRTTSRVVPGIDGNSNVSYLRRTG